MPEYVQVPPGRLAAEVLQQLLEEYVTRDGTDYGLQEVSTKEKALAVNAQLLAGDIVLIYEVESESWDLLQKDEAAALISN